MQSFSPFERGYKTMVGNEKLDEILHPENNHNSSLGIFQKTKKKYTKKCETGHKQKLVTN